jgi:hypothetical protein
MLKMRLWWKFYLKLRSAANFKFGHDLNFAGNFQIWFVGQILYLKHRASFA